METSNIEFIKQLAMRGDGISFLVKAVVTAKLNEKKLTTVSMKGQKIFLDANIAYLKDQHLSPPAQDFLDILRKLGARAKPLHGIGAFMTEMTAHPK